MQLHVVQNFGFFPLLHFAITIVVHFQDANVDLMCPRVIAANVDQTATVHRRVLADSANALMVSYKLN